VNGFSFDLETGEIMGTWKQKTENESILIILRKEIPGSQQECAQTSWWRFHHSSKQ
jgi:hypothetical protein